VRKQIHLCIDASAPLGRSSICTEYLGFRVARSGSLGVTPGYTLMLLRNICLSCRVPSATRFHFFARRRR